MPHVAGHDVVPVTGWLVPFAVSSKSATSMPRGGVDAEEVVHVEVGRGLGVGAALRDQRDRVGDAAAARVRADARAGAPEPQLEREVLAFSAGAAPNVTYWLEPLRTSEWPTASPGVAPAGAVAGEEWPPASTAVMT